MRSPTWHVEEALLLLMSGGFFVHLISASRRLADDGARVGDVLLRPVDGALFVLMAYCAVALLTRAGQFARTHDLTTRRRRVGYGLITAYVTVSLPGHALFLLTGDTRFFDAFPWWFSLAVLPVYALVVGYVLTLRPHPAPATGRAPRRAARSGERLLGTATSTARS